MAYQAVAFDMDGTLLNNQRIILPETIKAIHTIIAQGIKVVLVTGRHHSVVYPYYHQLKLNTLVVCCNGTYLYDFKEKKSLYANPLSKDQAKKLLNLVNEFGIHTLVYTDELITYEAIDDNLSGLFTWIASLPDPLKPEVKQVKSFSEVIDDAKYIYKFATSSRDLTALKAFSEAVLNCADFACEWSWIDRADVSNKGNSKGKGLARWAESEHIPMTDIVAFGDNYNDLSMLTTCGLGVAMGNADDIIQEKADLIIGNNNEPSIAAALNAIFKLQEN